ncbi:MAG: hypothetical protein ACYCYO_03800 [Bacilli bacterium]
MKKWWMWFASLVLTLVPAQAYAQTIPVPGVNTGASATSIFTIIGNLVSAGVTVTGGVALAVVLYSLLRAAMLFGLGGAQAQRRDEAKQHLSHAAIAGVFVGGAGIFVGALYAFGHGL